MKNKSILALFMFGFSLVFLPLQAQTDSLSVKPLIVPQDSIPAAYEWTARSPLSEAKKQQRADNRAEVEEMKRRFRAFHETASDKKEEAVRLAEDQDYLWDETKSDSVDMDAPKGNDNSVDTEELRREISRNFQDSSTPSIDWQLEFNQNTPTLRLAVEQTIILEQVQFDANSTELSYGAKNALYRWLLFFQQHPGMKIEIGAHANQSMGYTQALELTTRRARTINNYLISLGISEQQLIFRGYGKLLPLFLASDQENQKKNERIEVIILELPNH